MARYDLIDWQDGVLRDNNWLLQQSGLFRSVNVVETRLYPTPAAMEMDIAIGQGVNGRNALRISNKTVGSLPDFRIISRDKNHPRPGYGLARPSYSDGYLVPPSVRATKLHVIMKFAAGFRHAEAAATQSGNPENYHIGTHHFDPGLIPATGFNGGLQETFNWHHYHQLSVRHDLAKDGWVHFVISQTPTHQRSYRGAPAPKTTANRCRYWESCTTVYFAPVPYGDDWNEDPTDFKVNIPVPYTTLVDSIYVTDDEYQPVSIEFAGLRNWQEIEALAGVSTRWFDVVLTNTLAEPITGKIISHGMGQFTLVRDKETQANVKNTDITLAANEVRVLQFQTTIATGFAPGMAPASVAFIPASEESRPRYGANQVPSKADPYVCYRADQYGYLGPPDANICDAGITFRVVSALNGVQIPWTEGGHKWHCTKGTTLSKRIDLHDPQGLPVTVTLVDYDSVKAGEWQHVAGGGGSLTISPDGLVTFTPLADFEGTVFFRYRVSNGVRQSDVFGNWINVSKKMTAARSGNSLLTADGKLVILAN